jgi:hypothetical protein
MENIHLIPSWPQQLTSIPFQTKLLPRRNPSYKSLMSTTAFFNFYSPVSNPLKHQTSSTSTKSPHPPKHHHDPRKSRHRPHHKINSSQKWLSAFNTAITTARASSVPEMGPIKSLTDYYTFLDSILLWVPREDFTGTDVYNHFCLFYFVLDQPSVKPLQTPILPGPNLKN